MSKWDQGSLPLNFSKTRKCVKSGISWGVILFASHFHILVAYPGHAAICRYHRLYLCFCIVRSCLHQV
jgi:hypothetical protein